MEQYLLIGLIFYLIALIGNPGLREALKKQSVPSIAAGVTFILFWVPFLIYGVYYTVKKRRGKRNEQA